MPQPPQSDKLGKYTIRNLISRGSMGMVYLAHDALLERDVAIKVMVGASVYDEKMRVRFEREARAVARLHHPNIITIHDLGYDQNGSPFIAMELLDGADLDELIDKNPPSLGRRLEIIAQVCRGLAHAHRNGVVHRDIKPANIFVTRDDCAKIMDFGVARMTQSSQTQAGIVVGTAGYMSPEQLRGKTADGRSDIFSLGITLFEILTNEVLYTGDAIETIFFQTLSKPTPKLVMPDGSEVPGLQEILNRALAKDAENRYWSADEMEEAVQGILRTQRGIADEKGFLKVQETDSDVRPPLRSPDNISTKPIEKATTEPALSSRPQVRTARGARRRPRPSRLPWIAAIVTLLATAMGAYWFVFRQSTVVPDLPQKEVVETPTVDPIPPPEPVSAPETTPHEQAAIFAADAALALNSGDLEEADSLIDRGEHLDPESPLWEPLRDQLRTKEVETQRKTNAANLVSEARLFLDRGSYQEAIDTYEKAMEYDPQSLEARSELDRAIELEEIRLKDQEQPPRRFAESKTAFIPSTSDPNEMMGFEMEERLGIKETADALLPAQLIIEFDPEDAGPGEPYVLQVSVFNEGYRTIDIQSLELVSRFGQKETTGKGQQIPVRVPQVAPQTKAVVHEAIGTWNESQNQGEIEATITLADGSKLIKSIRW